MAAPVGCLLSAWLPVRGCGERASRLAWLGALVLVFTPWVSMPLHAFVPPPFWYPGGAFLRPELSRLRTEVFGHPPDPNRVVIEWLKRNAAPTDEILVNYEDFPLMFYLPNPIRGGIAAFRAEDDSKTPPSFLIIRQIVPFVHWPIFEREAVRHQWTQVPLRVPDIIWGNNPDPSAQPANAHFQPMIIARRVQGGSR
jgi:hypothetical protein